TIGICHSRMQPLKQLKSTAAALRNSRSAGAGSDFQNALAHRDCIRTPLVGACCEAKVPGRLLIQRRREELLPREHDGEFPKNQLLMLQTSKVAPAEYTLINAEGHSFSEINLFTAP